MIVVSSARSSYSHLALKLTQPALFQIIPVPQNITIRDNIGTALGQISDHFGTTLRQLWDILRQL